VARRIEVDIIGDASSLQRAFRETATGAQRFEAKITGSFHNIARSAVVAAGAFVGFSAVGEAFKTIINAAVDAQRSTRQLTAQMKASGESFTANRQAIEQAGLAMGKFGFTIEDSEKALTVLDRGTRNITRSISLQGVAANLARAKNMDLADAANVLAKVFGGQETALRRAVPGLSKHAHGLELIAQASQRLAGQAAAGTTAEERFHAILHDTEVVIGTALLPTVNKYLNRLSEWLDKMNRSGRLQRDVNQALQTATGIINALKGPVEAVANAFKTLGSAVGGTKNEVELLAAAFAAWKISGWITAFGALSGGIHGVGTSAKTSAGAVTGLRAALSRLGAMGVIGVTIAVSYEVAKGGQWFSKWLGKQGIPGVGDKNIPGGSLPDFARRAVAQGMSQARFVEAAGLGGISASAAAAAYKTAVKAATYTVTQPTAAQRAANIAGVPRTVSGAGGTRLYPLLTPADSILQYPSLGSALASSAASTVATRRLRFPGRVSGTGAIPGLAAFAGSETRGFAAGLHGYLGAYGPITGWQPSMALQIAQARAGAFGTTADQNQVLRRIRAAAMRALKSGRLVGQAWIDVYTAIENINQQLAQQTSQYVIKFRRTAHGLVPNRTPAYAGAGGVVIHGGLHLHGVQDMTSLENALEARAKRRPRPRRGR
jgi:hypothetical protein